MALEINDIYGVICIKGTVSNSHIQEVKGYFKTLLTFEQSVIINLCEVKTGRAILTHVLDGLKKELEEHQSLQYYSYPEPAVAALYAQLNDPANFYKAA